MDYHKKTALLIVISAAMFAPAFSSFAVMRAQFPDEKALQPFPSAGGVHANVSGSINSKVGQAPVPTVPKQSSVATPSPESSGDSGYSGIWAYFWIGIAVFILALLGAAFWKRRDR